MKVEVRFPGLEHSEAVCEHAMRRAQFQLSRFGREVTEVVVRLSDVNGPRGGTDLRCQVSVRGPRIGTWTMHGIAGDAYSGIDVTLSRMARSIARELDRARDMERGVAQARRA